jgi:hypothetical protein
MAATSEAVIDELVVIHGGPCEQKPDHADVSTKVVGEHLGDGAQAVMGAVRETFRYMQVAQEEIADVENQYPEKKEVIHDSFLDLMPGLFVGKSEQLYRSHCRELLHRVVRGAYLRLGTRAEVLMALHATSLRAPRTAQAASLFEKLFTDVFGEAARRRTSGGQAPWSEIWPGANDELFVSFRQRIRRDRRPS